MRWVGLLLLMLPHLGRAQGIEGLVDRAGKMFQESAMRDRSTFRPWKGPAAPAQFARNGCGLGSACVEYAARLSPGAAIKTFQYATLFPGTDVRHVFNIIEQGG